MAALYQLASKTLWGAAVGLFFAGGLLFFAGVLVGMSLVGSRLRAEAPGISAPAPATSLGTSLPGQGSEVGERLPQEGPRLAATESSPPPPFEEEPSPGKTAMDEPSAVPEAEAQVADAEAEPSPFSLQVGAYLQAENLERALAQLEKKGLEARVVEITDSRGTVLSSVRVGSYTGRSEAEDAAQKLRRRQGLDVLVKRELAPV